MSYTKAEALEKINAIVDPVTGKVTEERLITALSYLLDMKQLSTFIDDNGTLLSAILTSLLSANIPTWSNKAWPTGYFVYYNGSFYRANAEVSSGEAAPDVNSHFDNLDNLKVASNSLHSMSGNSVDWSLGEVFYKTLTVNTTLTFINANNALNKRITLIVTGAYTLAFPANAKKISGTYSTTKENYISIHCVSVDPINTANNVYYYKIEQMA